MNKLTFSAILLGLILTVSSLVFPQEVINGYRTFVNVTAPATPPLGTTSVYVDSTSKILSTKDDAGVVRTTAASIASGALTISTGAIAAGACQVVTAGSVNSAAAAGVLSTDTIQFSPSGSIKTATGFIPSLSGGLTIAPYPTAGYVNFDVCNWSNASITPGVVTLNWRVSR